MVLFIFNGATADDSEDSGRYLLARQLRWSCCVKLAEVRTGESRKWCDIAFIVKVNIYVLVNIV